MSIDGLRIDVRFLSLRFRMLFMGILKMTIMIYVSGLLKYARKSKTILLK